MENKTDEGYSQQIKKANDLSIIAFEEEIEVKKNN